MDTVFLTCFIFGALFTAASVLLGFAHVGVDGHALGHVDVGGHAAHGAVHTAHGSSGVADGEHGAAQSGLPYFNLSSVLAFITWFGATGYLLEHWANWLLLPTLIGALLAGAIGWVLILLFFRTVLKGESEMDPADYRMVGTVGRVAMTIPGTGVGEIVFTKAGSVRNEAARSLSGLPIPRDTEVVITDYARGVALVQPWNEFMADQPRPTSAPSGQESLGEL
jgi:hypothetical protein